MLLEWLEAGIAKLEGHQKNPKISIGLHIERFRHDDFSPIIKRILTICGKYVTKLSYTLTGEERFLLQDQFYLPNLNTLMVKHIPCGHDSNVFRFLLEDLLVAYGGTLKTLKIEGDCYIDPNSKTYPIQGLKSLSLKCFSPSNICNMITIFGAYISSFELVDMIVDWRYADDVDVDVDECFLPKLKHLDANADCLDCGVFSSNSQKCNNN